MSNDKPNESVPVKSGEAVRFEGIGYSRSGNRILEQIDHVFEAGKIHGIIGPSGSGKTTLLQLVNGLRQPDRGAIFFDQNALRYDSGSLRRRRKTIGYAIQEYGLFPHMNAWKNVAMPGFLEGWSREQMDNRARTLLEMVHLDPEKWNRYPHELSGGEKQRVGICRALFLDPTVLLLDEAFGALDPLTRSSLQQELLVIQKQAPRTILLVTHDIQEAILLSEQIVILRKGLIEQTGSPSFILQNPANRFVQEYLGDH